MTDSYLFTRGDWYDDKPKRNLGRFSGWFNFIAALLIMFVAYCVPVITKAQAYDRMIVVTSSAIPHDVNAFVQREWNVRHPIKPKRKPHHA